jgi:sugar phosphate isomerase/epimerase
VEAHGRLLNERAAALQPHGIELGYHNHNMEFRPVKGTTGWAVLLKELDPKLVFLELDLGWVTAGGLDPVAELRRLKGRVKMVHLKTSNPRQRPIMRCNKTPARSVRASSTGTPSCPPAPRRVCSTTSSSRSRPCA